MVSTSPSTRSIAASFDFHLSGAGGVWVYRDSGSGALTRLSKPPGALRPAPWPDSERVRTRRSASYRLHQFKGVTPSRVS